MPTQNKKFLGLASIIFVMIVWGSSFAVTKVVVDTIPPLTLACYRCSIGALTLMGIFFARHRRNSLSLLRTLPLGLVTLMGFLGVTVFYIFFNLSVKMTSASVGALLQGFIPVCIALLAAIFLKERLSLKQVAGILLSVTGVILIGFLSSNEGSDGTSATVGIASPTDGASGNSITGNLLMIIAIVAWGIYTILSKKVAHLDPLMVTCIGTLAGSVFLIPAAIYESYTLGHIPAIDGYGWLAVLFLGVLASGICYLLYNQSLQMLSAAEVGNFVNLDPLVGFLIALTFLHESVNTLQVIGAVLVVTGVVLSTGKNSTH